jgi:hypothetical protein
MKKSCPYEKEVLNGLETGDLKPEIKKHMGDCRACKETASVHGWMNRFQAVSQETGTAGKKLPDAESIWERAFSPRRYHVIDRSLEKKALRPLLIPQLFAYVAAVIIIAYILLSGIPGTRDLLNTGPEATAVFTIFGSMMKAFFKSLSSMLVPMAVGFFSIIVFIVITGLGEKRMMNYK